MNLNYWNNFYKKNPRGKNSSFSEFVLLYIKGMVFELGAGNGADCDFFIKNGIPAFGVDEAFEGGTIIKQDLLHSIAKMESPKYVYTRFLWHSISRKEQEAILRWVKGYLFIEARTTEDAHLGKVYKNHKRNFVNVPQLVRDLKEKGFQIVYLSEGQGLSPYKGEDPHLCRIVAIKKSL